jgi:tetratricopeptide (TPR) repeat protein
LVLNPGNERATSLVHEGWNHVMCQRPLAAWASWQRALLVDPDSAAAAEALSTLVSAKELPLAARTPYRFREPRDPARRPVWDERLRRGGLEALGATAEAFADLASGDPADSSAEFNRGLSLAWAGKNTEAIRCLDRAVNLDAQTAFEEAVSAWLLAELLRQGGGAETQADDLRFNCTIGWDPNDTPALLREFPDIRRIPAPRAPTTPVGENHDIEVFEWLDRPIHNAVPSRPGGSRLPIVLATVFVSRNSLRLSSPRLATLDRIADALFPRLEGGPKMVRREAAPLPLRFQDAALWIFRIPAEVEASAGEELAREAIEHYFENEWIHLERKGLGGRSPLVAAAVAKAGDAVARAKLTAVVKVREQLGSRVSTMALYKGYPFDRVRRRLGLERELEAAVDPLDLGCAAPDELDSLDPGSLDDSRLMDAASSAAGLGGDARTARFAAELLRRGGEAARPVDLPPLVSALVRQAISRGDQDDALRQIERARTMADAETAATLDIWRAEIWARQGRGDQALEVYQNLLSPDPAGAALALDSALTMLDNGHFDEAAQLLTHARDLARQAGLTWLLRRANQVET